MKVNLFFKDGRLSKTGSFVCVLSGLLMVGLVVWLEPPKIIYVIFLVIGVVLVGFAGCEARARALGLAPPFSRDPLGWRKAKESYNTPKDSKSAKDAESD